MQREDGSWVWRYQRFRAFEPRSRIAEARARLRRAVGRGRRGSRCPLMLVRGMLPQSVVDDDDEAELLRRLPDARVEHVEEAGHSVQGDSRSSWRG